MDRVIIAIRKADMKGPAPGNVEAKCPLCGELILLSRASQTRIRAGYVAICIACFNAEQAKDPTPNLQFEMPTTAELLDALGLTEKN